MSDLIRGEYRVRVYHTAPDDPRLSVDVFLGDDDRALAHLLVGEDTGTKLWRRFWVVVHGREDGRVHRDHWTMRTGRTAARLLRAPRAASAGSGESETT